MKKVIVTLLLSTVFVSSNFCMELPKRKDTTTITSSACIPKYLFSLNLKIRKSKIKRAAKKLKKLEATAQSFTKKTNIKVKKDNLSYATERFKFLRGLELYRRACQLSEALYKEQSKKMKTRWIEFYEKREKELEWLKENPKQVTVWDDMNPIEPFQHLILCKWRKELEPGS